MAITVEDGTIVAEANSYVTLAEADSFLELMGNAPWLAQSDEAKEATLIRAAFVVDDGATYVYDGNRQTVAQTMQWPRTGATYDTSGPLIPDNTIPPEIRRAQIVAAGAIADGRIGGAGSTGASGMIKSASVDVLSVSYFSPKETGGVVAGSKGSGGPYADIGWPDVTGIVAPLLDGAYYAGQDATGGGVSGAVAATRGPGYTPPCYGGIWHVGQDDALYDPRASYGWPYYRGGG